MNNVRTVQFSKQHISRNFFQWTQTWHQINRKTIGIDGLPAEILKVMGNKCIKTLTGTIPDDCLVSALIAIPKTPTARFCEDFWRVTLMSHVLKMFLRIICAGMYVKTLANYNLETGVDWVHGRHCSWFKCCLLFLCVFRTI